MGSETTFKGFNDIGSPSITETITTSLKFYLDWAYADKGAFFNVTIPKSGAYGGDESRLRPVQDPDHTDGQVWEAFRGDWVWESGVQQPTQPISISGVFVDGIFHANGSDHHVNYPDGQIVFDTAISTASTVQLEYSHRWIHVYDANDIPWLREAQFESFKIEDNFFNLGSGDRSSLARSRIQLPAIAVEAGINGRFEPYQLGLGQYSNDDVIFHIMAEDGRTADKLADYLSQQNERTIFLINLDVLAESGTYPLTYQGALASGAMTYPQMVEPIETGGFRWRKMRFKDARKQRTTHVHNNLHIKPVRMTTEVVLTGI